MCFLELAALGVLKLSDEVLCNFGSQEAVTPQIVVICLNRKAQQTS